MEMRDRPQNPPLAKSATLEVNNHRHCPNHCGISYTKVPHSAARSKRRKQRGKGNNLIGSLRFENKLSAQTAWKYSFSLCPGRRFLTARSLLMLCLASCEMAKRSAYVKCYIGIQHQNTSVFLVLQACGFLLGKGATTSTLSSK